jgi:predicted flap endonuclease-1-like 5' DNA nuclease
VEAQLAERNAEVNAQKARSLSTTARAPRTIAASAAVAGAPLNLLGFDTASQVLSAASEPTLENPVAALLPDETAVIPDNAIATAGSIFGKRIEPDDLTLIEGIGPAIRNLFAGAGFATWESLANAEPEQLHAILVEAGPAFAAHSPASWPEQARLAANANWFQLKSLQDKLVAGRALESAPESTDG